MKTLKAQDSGKRPVLVMGWAARIVVPIARSLHEIGVPVDVVDFALAPRVSSRAIREFRRVARPDLDRAQFVEQLRQFVQQGGHDMVIPSDDQTLSALTDHYDDLKDLLYIGCPPPETANLVLNKISTLEVAQQCGIRTPNTKLISNSAQLFESVGSLPFPWMLKPAQKETRLEETKSRTLATADHVTANFPTGKTFTPPMLLQEYCPGAGVGVEILMHKGECWAVFQHRRLKEFPYTGGFSVTAVAERPDPMLVEKSSALLRALRWEGPAMVEFKVNTPDGDAVLMEVNGRYWGTISLPIFAGINFPLYHWQLIHGEIPAIPEEYAVGTKWRWTTGHLYRLHSLLVAARHSSRARKALILSLLQLPATFSPSITDSLFSLSDPTPAIFELLHGLRYLSAYDLGALFKRFGLPLAWSSAK